jgi:hypothetical protein
MTEVTHWRCDRRDVDAVFNFNSHDDGLHWAQCRIGLKVLHFCPMCWKQIIEFIKLEEAKD